MIFTGHARVSYGVAVAEFALETCHELVVPMVMDAFATSLNEKDRSSHSSLRSSCAALSVRPLRSAPFRDLAASGCLDRGNVDLLHFHHRLERALGGRSIRAGRRLHQHPRSDLPRQAPAVLAPAALALGSAVTDDRVPVAIGLRLILGDNLKGEGFAVLEGRAAIQAEAGHPYHRELDRQHLALLASGVITWGAVYRGDAAVWKGLGVEPGGFFCGTVVPKANYVSGHRRSLLMRQWASPSEVRRKGATEIDGRKCAVGANSRPLKRDPHGRSGRASSGEATGSGRPLLRVRVRLAPLSGSPAYRCPGRYFASVGVEVLQEWMQDTRPAPQIGPVSSRKCRRATR